MMMGWDLVTLGDVCKVTKSRYAGELLPYVGMEHIESGTGLLAVEPIPITVKSATFLFSKSHVLYGRLRPYLNKVFVPDFEGHCSTEIFPFECGNRLDRRFLFYWLTNDTTVRLINLTSTGARMPRANVNEILTFDFLLPPLPEQKRIVAILDEVFTGISQAVANAEKNLANARELFESYLNNVFTRKGEGWVEKKIGDFSEVFDGPHATPKTVDSGPIFLGISALQDGVVNLEKTRHVTDADFKKWTRRVEPRENDIVFSYETRLGRAAIIPKNLVCCLGRRMGLVRLDPGLIAPKFFLYQYISPVFRYLLSSRTVHGATVDRIPLKDFPSFPFCYPNIEVQKQIVEQIDSLSIQVATLETIYKQKLTALTELKQSILQKAFTGQLTMDH